MPRWLQILLTLVLFTAAMFAVRAVLVAVLPAHNAWMDSVLGRDLHFAIVVALAVVGGIYGFWPRDTDGRMRPLLTRRR